jgi:hypothetical protein
VGPPVVWPVSGGGVLGWAMEGGARARPRAVVMNRDVANRFEPLCDMASFPIRFAATERPANIAGGAENVTKGGRRRQ